VLQAVVGVVAALHGVGKVLEVQVRLAEEEGARPLEVAPHPGALRLTPQRWHSLSNRRRRSSSSRW
jgi:hypothetical protein